MLGYYHTALFLHQLDFEYNQQSLYEGKRRPIAIAIELQNLTNRQTECLCNGNQN